MPKKTKQVSGQDFTPEIQSFINRFVDEMANDNTAVFVGAGLSVAAGYVDWKRLLKEVADDLGLSIDRETNLVALAQYHVNERQNRSVINQRILDEFSEENELTENHAILSRLPINTYWTTNYDRLIEKSLEKANKIVDVKYTVNQLKNNVHSRDAVVYKMHGDMGHPDSAILTKDDYEGYFREHEPFVTALSGDLVSKTMLFLGFSFSDPNIDYVLSRVRVTLRKQPKQHYCILKKEQKRAREKLSDFEYRKRQQSYLVKDLARIGVQALLIDDYDEITKILHGIEEQYRRRTVFISGSASNYEPLPSDKAHLFISKLSEQLVKRKIRIVTGFGLGVGAVVVGGALEAILGNRKKYKISQLLAQPFPAAGSAEKTTLLAEYRKQMIMQAGIAIFIFGNKRDDKGDVVLSDGVSEEFDYSIQSGLAVVPVGATGSMAEKLWERVSNDLITFYPGEGEAFKKRFKALGDPKLSPEQLVKAVLDVIDQLRRDQ